MEFPSKISVNRKIIPFCRQNKYKHPFLFLFPCSIPSSSDSDTNKLASLKLILNVGNIVHFLPESFWPWYLTQFFQANGGILLPSAFKNLSRHVRLEAVMGRVHLNRHLFVCFVGSRGLKIWPQRHSLLGNQETTGEYTKLLIWAVMTFEPDGLCMKIYSFSHISNVLSAV